MIMFMCSSPLSPTTTVEPYYGTAELGPWSYTLDEGRRCFQVC